MKHCVRHQHHKSFFEIIPNKCDYKWGEKISNYRSKCFTHQISFVLNGALGHEKYRKAAKKCYEIFL